MKKSKIKKFLRTLFINLLIVALLCAAGCSAESRNATSSFDDYSSENIPSIPYRYETGNHCCSDILKDIVGDRVISAAYDVIDAFTAHETSIQVNLAGNDNGFADKLGFVLNCIYPPFSACADYNSLYAYNEKDGTVSWEYRYNKTKCDEMISAFDAATADYMSRLCKGDTDTVRAILLYNSLTTNSVYDYDAVKEQAVTDIEDFDRRTSAYNALVNKSGICYSYSFALVYLYIRAGINCVTVSSFEGDGAHMWVMVELNGKYYYVDPTWDLGGGLYCFGMTSADRASWGGSYDEDSCRILSTPVSGNYVLDDEKFFDMRNYLSMNEPYSVEIDRQKQVAVITNSDVTYRLDCR